MIDKIKQIVSTVYNLDLPRGIFLSVFDDHNNIILSNGVLIADKPLGKTIEMLYHGLVEQHTNTHRIICDIVTHTESKTTLDQINAINLSVEGICIQDSEDNKSGILLPSTVGISHIPDAITFIKTKNKIEGNVNIYSFTTQRFETI